MSRTKTYQRKDVFEDGKTIVMPVDAYSILFARPFQSYPPGDSVFIRQAIPLLSANDYCIIFLPLSSVTFFVVILTH